VDSATGRRTLIVGCGISGPVLAMFLWRAGLEPVVYEERLEPNDEADYFLNLAPNGVAVLDALGVMTTPFEAGRATGNRPE
jgi:FAD-dependent urate hydroxylase